MDDSNPALWSRRRVLATGVLAAAASACSKAPVSVAPPEPPGKKGLCITTKTEEWAQKLASVNPHWFYSWASAMAEGIPAGVDFIPMIWRHGNEPERIAEAGAAAKAAGIDTLLGFNEPEKPSQANMSVEKALEAWPLLEATGLRLGSPGCVHADGDWMKEFMSEAEKRKLRIDFVCVHSYHGPNADALVKRLGEYHGLYGKPLWITEFAVGDWEAKTPEANRHRPEQVLSYMKEVLPRLEALDFLERYAWFPAKQSDSPLATSALFDDAGGLTPLGEFYRDF